LFNNKLNNHRGIAPIPETSNNFIFSDIEKANLLNDYFQSVFTQDDGSLPQFPKRTHSPDTICDVNITPTIVQKIIHKLKTNSAAGPDNLPPIFFLRTEPFITFPLSILFRSLIDLHTLPTEWKLSIITPIFKKGSPSNPANYRPIALTCTACKILESIIASDLLNFLHSHQLINKHQHGFLKKHSTLTNLLESVNDWSLSLSRHNSVAIAYIDFQRAFDSVPHPKLLHKLIGYGIDGNLLFWLSSFLTDRQQCVRVGSSLPHSCLVSSGVPQGSVDGPLFNLYVNCITDGLDLDTATTKIFADDVKIYTELSTQNSSFNLQKNLDLIHHWSALWQLTISYSKCNILFLGKADSTLNFSISGNLLLTTTNCTDLGIQFDPDLKFKNHISDIVKRAKQRSSLIHRCFISRNINHLIRAF